MTHETTAATQPRRRWLQFSLRTLLLVMIPIACLAAWLGSEYQRGQRKKAAIRWVEEHGGAIEYDDALTQANWRRRVFGEWFPESVVEVEFRRFYIFKVAPPDYKFPRHTLKNLAPLAELNDLRVLILEDCDFENVAPLAKLPNLRELRMNRASPADLQHLAKLENLEVLDLSYLRPHGSIVYQQFLGPGETNPNWVTLDLVPLAGLANMHTLDLQGNAIDDLTPLAELHQLRVLDVAHSPVEDLAPLANLHNLEQLALYRTEVHDLTPLASLKNLRMISLNGTEVSDLTPLAGLAQLNWLELDNSPAQDLTPLHGLKNLERVSLYGMPLIRADVDDLQAALPECEIKTHDLPE